jgi:hypothetical protein
MTILGWIFIFLTVFCVGVWIGFKWAAISIVELMRRRGFTQEEINKFKGV